MKRRKRIKTTKQSRSEKADQVQAYLDMVKAVSGEVDKNNKLNNLV